MRRVTALALVLSASVAVAAVAQAPSPATPLSLDTMVQRDVALLGFLDGVPLTLDETGQVRAYLDRLHRSRPETIERGSRQVAAALEMVETHNAAKAARVRELYRAALEAMPSGDVERAIVDSHDPTIAWDANAKLVISERTLADIRAAGNWVAHVTGRPPPDAALMATLRQQLADKFVSFDPASKAAYAHLESNMAAAEPLLDQESPAARLADLEKMGDLTKPVEMVRSAVYVFALTQRKQELLAARLSGGPGGPAGMMHALTERQLQQNLWSMRHAECSPVGSHPSSCSQAPILQPLRPF